MLMKSDLESDLIEQPQPFPLNVAAPGRDVALSWEKSDADDDTPALAPPPVWTRYIEDRLKHHCVR